MRVSLPAAGVVLLIGVAMAPADVPEFETVTIDPHAGNVCYAVTLADVDGDAKTETSTATAGRTSSAAAGRLIM